MGRKAKDTTLHRLANDLREVEWSVDHEHLLDEANELLSINELRNVYLMKDGKTFVVRLYCSGEERVIGFTTDIVAACRFADMARMRFWVHRTRDCREPVKSDLNFDVDSAKADLKNELQAQQQLDEIEKHLVNIGVLIVDETGKATNPAKKAEMRRTVRDDFLRHFTELNERIDTLTQRVSALQELFKHHRIIPQHIDFVDAEVIMSERADENTAIMKYEPATTWLRSFDVHIPHPEIPERIHHTITIQVPVKKQGDEWVLTPEAHAMIDNLKKEEFARLKADLKPVVDPVSLAPIGVINPIEDIFIPQPQTKTNP